MFFKRLFGRSKSSPPREWRAPAGQRLYAIGDIHGRRDLLDALLEKINADDRARGAAQTQIIFLGDLIDRGPDSRAVVERLMKLCADGNPVRILAGNHEELLVQIYDGDIRAAALFKRIGGYETLLSYGMTAQDYETTAPETLAALVKRLIPQAHIDFLRGFDDWIEAGDYLFVHAGIRPGLALEEQEVSDLRWIRREFTEHRHAFSHMVIHGHTITDGVDEHPNRIGIDTGAFATGVLTAIGIEAGERWFLGT